MTHQTGMDNQGSKAKRILALAKRFEELTFASNSDVEQFALKRLVENLELARNCSPFWRERLHWLQLNEATVSELLSKFKPMTKTTLREQGQFMSFISPGESISEYFQSATSGSTGEPVMVRKSHGTFSLDGLAVQLYDIRLQNRDVTKDIAMFRRDDSVGQNQPRGFPASSLGQTGLQVRIGFHKLSGEEMLDRLESREFGQVSIHASLLRELAILALETNRNISFDEAMNWAEPVDQSLRDLTREAFGARISDRYSSEEVGAIAMQCPKYEHLHALQFSNYVEILDDSGQPVGPGELGKVHVTCLANPNMPLIRYEIGDLASWGECDYIKSLPVIEPNIVRIRDSFRDESGRLITGGRGLSTSELVKDRVFPTQQMVLLKDAAILLHPPREGMEHVSLDSYRQDLEKRMELNRPIHFWEIESLDFLGIWKRRIFVHLPELTIAEVDGSEDLKNKILDSGYVANPGRGSESD